MIAPRALLALVALIAAWLAAPIAAAEDGYDLWLRYRPLAADVQRDYRRVATEIVAPDTRSPTLEAARSELARGFEGLLGRAPPLRASPSRDGAVIIGTPASPAIAALQLDLSALADEGYIIRSVRANGRRATVIAANTDIGALYGAFHFLRIMQTQQPLTALDIQSTPRIRLRVLNHWDNLDGTVERGYSGRSIWDWHRLPDWVDPRVIDYARANASIGINGAVVTNVNANATSLSADYLRRAAALADAMRPYGVRLYLTARFSAPMELGGLATADPLAPEVRAWWRAKADEIYRIIPDFGGFLVKANSEGQPGPQDYRRTHADGANMLAEALAPHGGVVMWRAFVYSADNRMDRHMQAFAEFAPLDGQFRDNVLLQIKNGAIDFQPREPFHPLFGAMPQTPAMMEFQITKEYLGFATHLVYLGTQWEEVLRTDTFARGAGSTVGRIVDGSVFAQPLTGIAGVANIGSDRNWSGSHFDQANWYAFGRLAWDHDTPARAIAEDWARMTFSNDQGFVDATVPMMMQSHQAVVDYMTPLGLHHLMATGHHYGPGPWVSDLNRPEWNPTYYHRADRNGIGFDRTASGSNALSQYAPEVAAQFADPATISEDLLLWFHHAPWDRRMQSGRTLWDELVVRYSRGVTQVQAMRATWQAQRDHLDPVRFADVDAFLQIQESEAQWWRDASLAYFQTFARRPYPEGYAAPPHPLEHYIAIDHPYAPGNPGRTAAPFRN